MSVRLPAALLAFALLSACQTTSPIARTEAQRPAPIAGTVVTLDSTDPAGFAQILTRTSSRREIEAELFLPSGRPGPAPAVVILHGWDGVGDRERMYAGALAQAGIAAIVPRSIAGRGGAPATDAPITGLSPAAQLADAIAAYRLLAADARFDGRRIGVMGFSQGGTVAMLAAHVPFLRAASGADAAFAAHLPIYPTCDWRMRTWKGTGAAIMTVTAEKDDWAPPENCLPSVEGLSEAGNPVANKRYAGAHHEFDSAPAGVKHRPDVRHVSGCASEIDEKGNVTLAGRNVPAGTVRLDASYRAYAEEALRRCGRKGVHVGSAKDVRGNVAADVVTFFTETLKPLSPTS